MPRLCLNPRQTVKSRDFFQQCVIKQRWKSQLKIILGILYWEGAVDAGVTQAAKIATSTFRAAENVIICQAV